ncbi:MAG: DUF1845 domain-containing protein [Acidovorax sp.]
MTTVVDAQEATMADIQIVKTDQGAVNARILAKEAKADFRRVEAASLKLRTHFTSAEAKRLFVRMFNTLQLNAHFVSVIARTRIDHQDIEAAEVELRTDIDAVKNKLNQALDGAEALFKSHGISSFATYDTQPLEIDVGVLSSSGRRYLEVLNQFDQLMPLLQTLEIHEVITTQALDIERAALKRQIKNIATLARRQATGMRRRMNALGTRDEEHAAAGATGGRSARAEGAEGSRGGPGRSQDPLLAKLNADGAAGNGEAIVVRGGDAGEERGEEEGGERTPGRQSPAQPVLDPMEPAEREASGSEQGMDDPEGSALEGGEGVQVRRVRRRALVLASAPEAPSAGGGAEQAAPNESASVCDAGPAVSSDEAGTTAA